MRTSENLTTEIRMSQKSGVFWFIAENHLILYPSFENSTTHIATVAAMIRVVKPKLSTQGQISQKEGHYRFDPNSFIFQ